MTRPEATAYVAAALALDPRRQAAQLVALRAAFLGVAGQAAQAGSPVPTRQTELSAVQSLAAQFWELPPAACAASCAALGAVHHADLLRWVGRLAAVAAVHAECAALWQDAAVPAAVREELRRIVVAAPRESRLLRGQQLRRTKPPAGRAVARHIIRRYPGLAAIEGDHLAQLGSLARSRKLASKPVALGGGVLGVLAGWMVIKLVLRFLEWLV